MEQQLNNKPSNMPGSGTRIGAYTPAKSGLNRVLRLPQAVALNMIDMKWMDCKSITYAQ